MDSTGVTSAELCHHVHTLYRNIVPERSEFIWEEVVYLGIFPLILSAVISSILCLLLNISIWGVFFF